MKSKVVLKLNKNLIQKAKSYAKDNKTSLSKLIENYLSSLPEQSSNKKMVTPLVESLTGVVPEQPIKEHESDYFNYLDKKYS